MYLQLLGLLGYCETLNNEIFWKMEHLVNGRVDVDSLLREPAHVFLETVSICTLDKMVRWQSVNPTFYGLFYCYLTTCRIYFLFEFVFNGKWACSACKTYQRFFVQYR